MLRYVEIKGLLRRGIAVIKMRGSQHHKAIFEFVIDSKGFKIKEPFDSVSNILLGTPVEVIPEEKDQLNQLFHDKQI